MLKMPYFSLHILSQPLSKTHDSFVLWKIFPYLLQCNLLFLALDEAFKKLRASLLRHDFCRGGVQIWRVMWPLLLLNHFASFVEQYVVLCVQSPMHLTESAVPSGSSW